MITDSAAAAIIVEGKSDCHFVRQYLRHLPYGYGDLLFDCKIKSPDRAGKIMVCPTGEKGGGDGALIGKKISERVLEIASVSNRALLVVDANGGGDERRKKFEDAAQKIKANTGTDTKLFLLPDDKNPGKLESLLLRIFRDPEIGGVAECFDNYEECLRSRGFNPPDLKGKIYAYCEAHRAKPREDERNYLDAKRWNLEHTELQPLRDFLLNNLSSPAGEKA
ncbi:MAG: DUF3226 domain-containing protein [Gammaproteobacteria bacterium]